MSSALYLAPRTSIRSFIEKWTGRGRESSDTQKFWLALLREVFGVKEPDRVIQFEVPVKELGRIDAVIESTGVLIEQKGRAVSLDKAERQSDGAMLTPYQQGKRYADRLGKRPNWVIACNFDTFEIHDLRKLPDETPEILKLSDLEKEFYRLEFLVDAEKVNTSREEEISVAAGELVGKIYDGMLKHFKTPDSEALRENINKLCVRLVFCLYAEDAGLFAHKRQFHDYLKDRSLPCIRNALLELFRVLDTPENLRNPNDNPDALAFPYVDGGLFADQTVDVPQFSQELKDLLLKEASEGFDWSGISPTIFGAVFESTLDARARREGGMHYTSVENIRKVIRPLFMDDLNAEFEKIAALKTARTRKERLEEFQTKLSKLKFLDPACGSGNFLTETYLELRHLENIVIQELNRTSGGVIDFGGTISPVQVQISQFYGIEINDFAVSVAQTALWIAESQMLKETEDLVGAAFDFFPLKSNSNIHEGNALRMDWNSVVSKEELSYIMGNPPFIERRYRNTEQTADLARFFSYKDIDYVACWFIKSAEFIHGTAIRCALVATNSITQGEQVAPLWDKMYSFEGMHIDFAYRTFVWDSQARDKAHVHCVIIGFSEAENAKKIIFNGEVALAKNINPYLADAPNILVRLRSSPLCDVPPMQNGNVPLDGDALKIEPDDLGDFAKCPYVKRLMGGRELLHNERRYVLWLVDVEPTEYMHYPKVLERVKQCRINRLGMKEPTKQLASRPAEFRDTNNPSHFIAMPIVSSVNRAYIPMAYLGKDVIPTNQIQTVPESSIYHFGVLESRVHMAWMRTVAGRLKSDYRYSKEVVYNNFVWPDPDPEQKHAIEKTAKKIIAARESYPNASLAEMYGPNMPLFSRLADAHEANDKAVLDAYGLKSDASEGEIVSHLMNLYVEKSAEADKVAAGAAAKKKGR